MTDNMNTQENSTLSCVPPNDTETSQEASSKMSTDKVEWSILEFDTDVEDDIERFKDLVPSIWISSNKTVCWYPIYEHKSTIQKFSKQCEKVKPEWNCYSIKIIEENISTFF